MILDVHDIAVSGIFTVVNKPIIVKIYEKITEKLIPSINMGNILNDLSESKVL